MESPLEVLSRAATMVQDNANEPRLTTKELPTTKWRRERRLRTTEYHHSLSSSTSPSSPQAPHSTTVKPLMETTNTTTNSPIESPIDMSVTSTTIKPRPPPPYREPLPGSTFATALPRPSVITQAPKRDNHHNNNNHHSPISNRENDNCSSESISMCDPVIDEHFRRSLGADYMALYSKKSPTQQQHDELYQRQPVQQPSSPKSPIPNSPKKSPIPMVTLTPPTRSAAASPILAPVPQPGSPTLVTTTNNNDPIGTSVDDHFAKALGDTWKKLQADREMKSDALEK